MRNALVIALLALTGCPDEPPDRFECHIDEQCVEDGEQGYCEESNDCSFEDEMCASSRRYARLSAEAGACVETNVSTSLVSNGGFEDGVTGWEGLDAEISASDDAHTMDSSVRVCRTGAAPMFAVVDVQAGALNPQVEDRYTARAWVKAESATAVRFVFHPTGTGADPPDADDTSTEPPVVAGSTWQEVTAQHDVMGGLDRLYVRVEAEQAEGAAACFLVDDIAVFKLPP